MNVLKETSAHNVHLLPFLFPVTNLRRPGEIRVRKRTENSHCRSCVQLPDSSKPNCHNNQPRTRVGERRSRHHRPGCSRGSRCDCRMDEEQLPRAIGPDAVYPADINCSWITRYSELSVAAQGTLGGVWGNFLPGEWSALSLFAAALSRDRVWIAQTPRTRGRLGRKSIVCRRKP